MKFHEPVTFNDGASISIQASRSHYCGPRVDECQGGYNAVECGFYVPNGNTFESLEAFRETRLEDSPPSTVFPYVPVSVVAALIAWHGGILQGECPNLPWPFYTVNTSQMTFGHGVIAIAQSVTSPGKQDYTERNYLRNGARDREQMIDVMLWKLRDSIDEKYITQQEAVKVLVLLDELYTQAGNGWKCRKGGE
jgi:hypothetical protein